MKNIGLQTKNFRENLDLKQTEIAKLLNISSSSISHYENNDRIYPIKKLNELTNIFSVSLDFLLGYTTIKNYSDQKAEINIILSSERLKSLCKEQNLSYRELARFLNTSDSTIRQYINQKNVIITAFLVEIANKYNYSIDYLLGKTDIQKYIHK